VLIDCSLKISARIAASIASILLIPFNKREGPCEGVAQREKKPRWTSPGVAVILADVPFLMLSGRFGVSYPDRLHQ
jgi:hypothetical protein